MADQPQPQEGGWRGGQVSAAHALRVAAALRVPVSCVPRGRWPLRPLPLLSGGCCCRLGQAKDLGPVSTGRRVCSPPRGRTFELCPGLTGDELRAWSRPPGLWQSRVVRQTLLKLSRNTGNASAPQLMGSGRPFSPWGRGSHPSLPTPALCAPVPWLGWPPGQPGAAFPGADPAAQRLRVSSQRHTAVWRLGPSLSS